MALDGVSWVRGGLVETALAARGLAVRQNWRRPLLPPSGHAPPWERPEILDRRREMVEHPFGSIKQWMNQGAFLMKGLDNVRAEFSLTALVYNLRRALNILGVEAMMAAARR